MAVLGDVDRMVATRTKVAVDEAERAGRDRADSDRVKARNDIAQIVAETGTLLNFVGRKMPKAKVTVERAVGPCSKRTLKLNVVSEKSSVCTVPRLIVGPGIVLRIMPASGRVKDVKGQHRQVGAQTPAVPPGGRDAGKSQKGKGTDEQGDPAKLPAQPGP